jgi:hypothetical protein
VVEPKFRHRQFAEQRDQLRTGRSSYRLEISGQSAFGLAKYLFCDSAWERNGGVPMEKLSCRVQKGRSWKPILGAFSQPSRHHLCVGGAPPEARAADLHIQQRTKRACLMAYSIASRTRRLYGLSWRRRSGRRPAFLANSSASSYNAPLATLSGIRSTCLRNFPGNSSRKFRRDKSSADGHDYFRFKCYQFFRGPPKPGSLRITCLALPDCGRLNRPH